MRGKKPYQLNIGFNVKKKPVITEQGKIDIENIDNSAKFFDEYFKKEAEREINNKKETQKNVIL